jgi:hypothetical protein
VSCGSTARHAKEFTPSPYDCRPGIPGSGSQLRTGGHATQGGAPLAPDALETPAVWVSRVEFGIYRLGVSRAAAASVDGLGFVDLAEVGSVLSEGRPFGMVEGTGGMLGLVSSISGEVISGTETFLLLRMKNDSLSRQARVQRNTNLKGRRVSAVNTQAMEEPGSVRKTHLFCAILYQK